MLVSTSLKKGSNTLPFFAKKLFLDVHFLFQILINGIEEFLGVKVMLAMIHLVAMNAYRKILRHFTAFYGFNANRLQCLAKINERLVIVKFTTEGKASCPGKD